MLLHSSIQKWFIGDLLDSTDDLYEKARITLIFNFPFFTGLLISISSITFLILGIEHSVMFITMGWVFCFSLLFILKYLKNVWVSAFIYCFGITTILISNLLLNYESMHLGFPYWMFTLILLSVFTLGIWYASIITLISGAAFLYYRQYLLAAGISNELISPDARLLQSVLEMAISCLLILHIIHVYIKTTRLSEKAIKNSNTELSKRNKVILNQSAEKTIMLREIHHRVKNNLQLVTSILRLQSSEIEDPKALEVFDLSQKRIIAMSLIHERLYKVDRMESEIKADYLPLLIQDLVELYSNNQKINSKVDFEEGFISQENVLPFGLIVNELISNSLKHGIAESGEIKLSGVLKGEVFEFQYSDNGKGMPKDFKKDFGIELIESFTEQLDGKVEYANNPTNGGVIFNFTFGKNIKDLN